MWLKRKISKKIIDVDNENDYYHIESWKNIDSKYTQPIKYCVEPTVLPTVYF